MQQFNYVMHCVHSGSLVIEILNPEDHDIKTLSDLLKTLAERWVMNMTYIVEQKGEKTSLVFAEKGQVGYSNPHNIAAVISYSKTK